MPVVKIYEGRLAQPDIVVDTKAFQPEEEGKEVALCYYAGCSLYDGEINRGARGLVNREEESSWLCGSSIIMHHIRGRSTAATTFKLWLLFVLGLFCRVVGG